MPTVAEIVVLYMNTANFIFAVSSAVLVNDMLAFAGNKSRGIAVFLFGCSLPFKERSANTLATTLSQSSVNQIYDSPYKQVLQHV